MSSRIKNYKGGNVPVFTEAPSQFTHEMYYINPFRNLAFTLHRLRLPLSLAFWMQEQEMPILNLRNQVYCYIRCVSTCLLPCVLCDFLLGHTRVDWRCFSRVLCCAFGSDAQ